VPGAKTIVGTLRAQSKTVEAVRLPNGVEAILTARENLVDINLMAHVPDEAVLGGAENAVQGNGEFHDTEIGPEMAATFRQTVDKFLPDFARQRFQLGRRQFFYMRRSIHHVQVSIHNYSSADSAASG